MGFSSLLSSLVGTILLLTPSVSAKLCFVLYQMADNDLEYFLRLDLGEYMQSDLMKDPNTISWIYFDNGDPDAYGDSPKPLPDIFDIDGAPLDDRTEDVYYLSYNHEFGQMLIMQNLGELNSDTKQVVQNFVTTALRDCKEKGATEYMMSFSSHGAGFGGFGGDEVTRRRRLFGLMDNQSIAGAIRNALDSEIAVGAKLNVLGFDACLMMDYGALDDYGAVAENFLASEDVEPGHGWSYAGLKSGSAVNVATEIVELFASDPQSYFGHQTPKTLAVVDTAAHAEFAAKWEEFSRLLTIAYKEDENIQAALKRARGAALKFEGDTDFEGEKDKDMVDMMDFVRLFDEKCAPTGELAAALKEVQNSYSAQFVTFKIGPGTDSRYTGMGVLFPSKQEKRLSGLDEELFTSDRFATKSSPNWLDFLRTYYDSPVVSGTNGYCSSELATEDIPEEVDGLLMINPTISEMINGRHNIETGVVKRVDDVFIEFGIDYTDLLQYRRHLLKARTSSKPSSPMGRRAHQRFLKSEMIKQSHRRLNHDDYLYLFGGDCFGKFVGSSTYSSSWDGQFVVIGNSADDLHLAYVYNNGESGREIPVLYFPANKPITSVDVRFMIEYEDAEAKGAMPGYIKFSTDSGVGTTLYTSEGYDTYSETPTTAGGQIVPIVYVSAMIDGYEFYQLIGGFESVVFDWSTTTPLIIDTRSGDEEVESGGILTLDMFAEDYDTGDSGYALFEILDGVPIMIGEGTTDGLFADDDFLYTDDGLLNFTDDDFLFNFTDDDFSFNFTDDDFLFNFTDDDIFNLTDDGLFNLTDDGLFNFTDDDFPIDDDGFVVDDNIDDDEPLTGGDQTVPPTDGETETDAPDETDPPTDDLTTEVPVGTDPPTAETTTAAPGGETEAPRGTDAPRSIDSSAPSASGTVSLMTLTVVLVHLVYA